MTRSQSLSLFALLMGAAMLTGCRTQRVVSLGSTSVTVPADWHKYESGTSSRSTALQLQRAGIPFVEKDSVAGFYVSSNPTTNTPQGAQVWQERMLQPPNIAKGATSTKPRISTPFFAGEKEQIAGKYVTLCVASKRPDTSEVLNCVVVGAPVMFSFAGSKKGAVEARAMLRSLQ